VGHNTTSLNILFGAFRKNGLPIFSRIQKSAIFKDTKVRNEAFVSQKGNSSVGYFLVVYFLRAR